MELSVIIPTFNGAENLAEQLEALAHQLDPVPFEVIISDNGSTDRTLDIVRQYIGKVPGLRIIDSSNFRGRSHARNVGTEAASAEALAFSDQDDVVGEGWVRAMASALERYDFVTGPIESHNLNEPWQVEFSSYPDHGPQVHKYPPYLAYAPANNLGVKRELHLRIGGFDESLTFGWEDADYSFRLQLAGTKLHFALDAIVHYRLRNDFAEIYRQAKAYGRGNVAFYKKYEPVARIDRSLKSEIASWFSLFRPRLLLGLRKKAKRALWLTRLGWQIGHIQGCIAYGVLAPLFWM